MRSLCDYGSWSAIERAQSGNQQMKAAFKEMLVKELSAELILKSAMNFLIALIQKFGQL